MKKAVTGFLLGVFVVLLLGATYIGERVVLSGSLDVWQNRIYHSSLSGVTDKGECYLAVTNTWSGHTEVFLISEKLRQQFVDNQRPIGTHGSITFFGHGPVDSERR